MEKKLLIVDGTSILAEAYYKSLTKEVESIHSLRDSGKTVSVAEEDAAFSTLLQSKKGVSINAVQGFIKVLFDAMDKLEPTHLIVNWGAQREDNFRRKIFSGYKDDGKVKDRELLNQESLTKKLLKDFGVFQLESSSLEALDLAGMLINKYKKDFKVDLLARNTLSLQFTDDATVWFKTPAYENLAKRFNLDCTLNPLGTIKFDEDFLLEYKNLKPYQLPDYRALIGNSFSKIPGVKSVGEVTTVALLEEYDSIENLYDDIDACGSHDELVDFGNELTKHLMLPFNPMPFLVKGRDDAFLGKQLATYQREDTNNLLVGLDASEFDLSNVDKVEIVKKLKTVSLSPITCNVTKGLTEIINNLDYSALVVSYNFLLYSPSSSIFTRKVEDVAVLYELVDSLAQDNELRTLVNINDFAITEFGDKLAFDLHYSEYYSGDTLIERVEEANKLKELKENLKAVANVTVATTEEKSTDVEESIEEEISKPIMAASFFDPEDGLKVNYSEIDSIVNTNNSSKGGLSVGSVGINRVLRVNDSVEDSPSSSSLSVDTVLGIDGFPKGRLTEIYDSETSGKTTVTLQEVDDEDLDEIEMTIALAEQLSSELDSAIKSVNENNFELIGENYSEVLPRFITLPTPGRYVSAHEHSANGCLDANSSITETSSENQNSNNPTKTGLSLLEQMVISKFVCNHCGEEFMIVGSTADYCIKCGAKNVSNN